jgi:hypothetical protein
MAFLLSFNLFLYVSLGKPFQWKHMFTDLQWGVLLPLLALYLRSLAVGSNVLYKAVETLALGAFLLWIVAKDDPAFVKSRLLQIKRAVSKT